MLKFARFLFALLFWILLIGGIAVFVLSFFSIKPFDDFMANLLDGFLTDVENRTIGIYAILIALFLLLPLYCIVGLSIEVKAIKRQLKKSAEVVPVVSANNQNETVDLGGANYKILKLE